jgi:hypothetical protein
MTKSAVGPRCRWCGRKLDRKPGAGRPPKYCRQSCRQQAYLARKLAAAHGLGDDDVIMSRAVLEELQGLLYCLHAAVEDVDGDLATSDAPGDVRDALGWLLDNARPLAAVWIEPRTGAEEAAGASEPGMSQPPA